MREIWVRSLGWEDPLEEGMATHSSILAWRIPMDGGTWWATVHGVTTERLSTAEHTSCLGGCGKLFTGSVPVHYRTTPGWKPVETDGCWRLLAATCCKSGPVEKPPELQKLDSGEGTRPREKPPEHAHQKMECAVTRKNRISQA